MPQDIFLTNLCNFLARKWIAIQTFSFLVYNAVVPIRQKRLVISCCFLFQSMLVNISEKNDPQVSLNLRRRYKFSNLGLPMQHAQRDKVLYKRHNQCQPFKQHSTDMTNMILFMSTICIWNSKYKIYKSNKVCIITSIN